MNGCHNAAQAAFHLMTCQNIAKVGGCCIRYPSEISESRFLTNQHVEKTSDAADSIALDGSHSSMDTI